MNEIRITCEGGVIQAIDGIPEGVKVIVMDFDSEGVDPSELKYNDMGESYVESVWESDENLTEDEVFVSDDGTMRYFEIYVPATRDSGSGYGFKTETATGKMDKEKIIELAIQLNVQDAEDATDGCEITKEEYYERYELEEPTGMQEG